MGDADLQTAMPYHVRVLIPCYNESLEIVGKTAMAALDAMLPVGCSRTVYICDDGKDAQKRKWSVISSLDLLSHHCNGICEGPVGICVSEASAQGLQYTVNFGPGMWHVLVLWHCTPCVLYMFCTTHIHT